MSGNNLIFNALNNYYDNFYKYQKLFKDYVHFVEVDETDNLLSSDTYKLYDKNKKLICTCEVDQIGLYNKTNNRMRWAWSFETIGPNKKIMDLLRYGITLTGEETQTSFGLKKTIMADNVYLRNDNYKLFLSIISYILKFPLVLCKINLVYTENIEGGFFVLMIKNEPVFTEEFKELKKKFQNNFG